MMTKIAKVGKSGRTIRTNVIDWGWKEQVGGDIVIYFAGTVVNLTQAQHPQMFAAMGDILHVNKTVGKPVS